jgi:predicted secreted hydrolase
MKLNQKTMRRKMGKLGHWPAFVLRLLSFVLILAACAPAAPAAPPARLTLAEALSGGAGQPFARALAPRPFTFPRDHGPHEEFAAEWWYYTGNLDTADGRHFGYQLTFFRFGLAPGAPRRPSDFAANSIYMAHFALADVATGRFAAFDRFSRGAAGLAGAQGEPFRVWLDDWSATGAGPQGLPMRLHAAEGDLAIDLTLESGKPPVLQGDRGLSQKSAEPGNASYYYSLTRMPTSGTVQAGGARHTVRGLSWMDREWSTSALGPDQAGWDWFALQLSDGRDLMFYRLRLKDGTADPYSGGLLVAADGSARRLARDDVQLDVLGQWRSPHSGATYPSGWRLRVPATGLDLRIIPYLPNQELPLAVVYWEGAVRIDGEAAGAPVTGAGYVELTGYAEQQGAARVR